MATDNVEFYERMQKLQVLQQQREQQRMSLEKEFNTYLKSDKRLNRVHANKLQSYWNKICEDERRSRARNEQLLQDYHRVETHVAALSARTDRLKLLKDQYEKQVELMYPAWQEQVELKRRQRLLQQQKEQQQLAYQLQQAQQQQQQQQYLQGRQQQAVQQQRENYLPQRQVPSEPRKQPQDVATHQQQKDQGPFSMQQQHQNLQQPQQQPQQHQNLQQPQQHQNLQQPQQQPQQLQYLQQPQQHPQQPYLSTPEALNLNNDYNHLRRTSPLIPNIHVQPNTPPILASGDPRYTSIQFGTQPASLSYRIPGAGQGDVTNLQGAQDTGSYQVPSAGSTFGTSQPQIPNGSLMSYGQLGSSGGPNVSTTVEGLHVPLTDPDAGYTRLQDRRQGPETDLSGRHPGSSSVYSEVRSEGMPGLQIPSTRLPQPQGDPGTLEVQTAPAAMRKRNEVLNADISTTANSHVYQQAAEAQASRGSGGITAAQADPVPQAVKKTVLLAQDDDEDDDSIATPLDEEDPYLMPEKLHQKSSTAQKPAERAGSSVSAKAVSTARTDPFTSEDEDEEEEEDVAEKEALRDALQNQLQLGNDRVPERKQTGPLLNSRQKPKGEQVEKNRRNLVSGKSETRDDQEKEESAAPETPNDEGGDEEEEEEEEEEESGSEDEIGSDMSLPLSDTGAAERPGPRADKNKPSAADEKAQQARSSQPQVATVTVTEQGFWNLVSAVELEIDQSDNIEKIYNLPDCTTAIKTEIVRTANSNSSLEHLNPNAISMVVLEQLPKLVQQLPGGCLLSDKVLDSQRTITEVTIRSFLYSSALSFWDKLLQHLVQLIRKGVMDAEDVSTIVAPLLISPGSAWADKAVDVLMSILQDIERQEESQLEDTYSSLPSASATPSHLSMPRHEQPGPQLQGPLVPPLNLGGTINQETPDLETDRVSHDSFFDEPAVPLTETKAYQQMMQSSQGHQARPTSQEGKGGGEEDEDGDGISSTDDEEDDEIEKATRLSPETPPSSRNKKRRNVLSSLGGSGSLGITYGNDDDDDDDEAGSQGAGGGGDTKRSEQMSDLISSPSPSPSPKGSGYVPSAMEQSMKSTGRSDPMQRSAAFWGEESDMEESEMTVPMGTGTLKSDDFKDDFDFYD